MAIAFVGSAKANKAGDTSATSTMALDAGLTGGSRSSVQTGDLVIAVLACTSTVDRALTITDGSTAYTLIGSELYADDTRDINLRVAYKFMGGTPDTTVTFGPSGNAFDTAATMVYVFSGVDSGTPLDVAAVTATGIDTGRANPPSITPTTSGAVVVAVGAGSDDTVSTADFTSSDLTSFISQSGVVGDDSRGPTLGIGYLAWTSGAFDAAQFGGGSTGAGDCWASVVLALRPSSARTLAADSGTYSYTGTAATPKRGRVAAAAASSFAFTPTAVALKRGFSLSAAASSFAFTPTAAGLLATRILAAASVNYDFTAVATSLRRGYSLAAASAAFAFTPSAATLNFGRKLAAGSSTFAFTPTDATLSKSGSYAMVAGATSFTFAPTAAGLRMGRKLTAASSSYTFTSAAAGLRRTLKLSASASAFTWTSSPATLLVTALSFDPLGHRAMRIRTLNRAAMSLDETEHAAYSLRRLTRRRMPL